MKKPTCLLLFALLLLSACTPASSSVSMAPSSSTSIPASSSSVPAVSSSSSVPSYPTIEDGSWREYDNPYKESDSPPPSETGLVGNWAGPGGNTADELTVTFYLHEDYSFLVQQQVGHIEKKITFAATGTYSIENDYELHLSIQHSYQERDGKAIYDELAGTTTLYWAAKYEDDMVNMRYLAGYPFNWDDEPGISNTAYYGDWEEVQQEELLGTWSSSAYKPKYKEEADLQMYYTFNADGTFRYELADSWTGEVLNYFEGTYTLYRNQINFTVTKGHVTHDLEWYEQYEDLNNFTSVYGVGSSTNYLDLSYYRGGATVCERTR